MTSGWILILIGIFLALVGKGGRGRVNGGGLVVSGGAGIILIVAGALLLSV